MKSSQPAQFKRTNIKVIKTQSLSQSAKGGGHPSNGSYAPPNLQLGKDGGNEQAANVINV